MGKNQETSLLSYLTETRNRYKLFKDPLIHSIAKVESSLISGARKYFYENKFIEITIPHITKATGACENIATMFEIDFFGERRYLAQTGQLYLEVLTPFLDRVWTMGPSFRAEPEVDDRHLVEFTLIELEHKGGFEELLAHIEGVITSMVNECINNASAELDLLGVEIERLKRYSPPFKRISYTEAIEILSDFGLAWGDDLKSSHEKYLVSLLGNKPLFITHYPKKIKFFNMKENEKNPDIVNSADLILPYSGEAVGAAEREYEYERLRERLVESSMLKMLEERGGSIEDFDWYLNFYKEYNGCEHSGCGIGLNRVTQSVLGSSDIRSSTIWPMNRESVA